MNISKSVEAIFNYKSNNGTNCLTISFSMNGLYQNQTGKRPDSSLPLFNETETTILYLIKLAEENKLKMNKILNSVNENGMTLFASAALYSESIARELLTRNVDVKTIDGLFQTPGFRVSKIFCLFYFNLN